MKRLHIFIKGRVQMVSFRYYTKEKALELNLNGWIRNLDDGRVEVVVEGIEDKIKEMLEFLKEGPRFSKVEDVEVKEEEVRNEEGFEVK